MLTRYERELYNEHRREPIVVAGVVLKAAVVLSILALLAWIGADRDTRTTDAHMAAAPVTTHGNGRTENASARHRKELFDQRRVRFNEVAYGQATASLTPDP
jgi:hypothetical protein